MPPPPIDRGPFLTAGFGVFAGFVAFLVVPCVVTLLGGGDDAFLGAVGAAFLLLVAVGLVARAHVSYFVGLVVAVIVAAAGFGAVILYTEYVILGGGGD